MPKGVYVRRFINYKECLGIFWKKAEEQGLAVTPRNGLSCFKIVRNSLPEEEKVLWPENPTDYGYFKADIFYTPVKKRTYRKAGKKVAAGKAPASEEKQVEPPVKENVDEHPFDPLASLKKEVESLRAQLKNATSHNYRLTEDFRQLQEKYEKNIHFVIYDLISSLDESRNQQVIAAALKNLESNFTPQRRTLSSSGNRHFTGWSKSSIITDQFFTEAFSLPEEERAAVLKKSEKIVVVDGNLYCSVSVFLRFIMDNNVTSRGCYSLKIGGIPNRMIAKLYPENPVAVYPALAWLN